MTASSRPTPDQIKQWKDEFGKIIAIDDPAEMIFRKPNKPIFSDFMNSITTGKGTHEMAYIRMSLACLLYPSVPEAQAIFEEYPGLPVTVGDLLGELAGHKSAVSLKNL